MDAQRFERLHAECRRIIGGLRKRAAFPVTDFDDLEQEMALALLQMDGHTDSYCLGRAAWAALMWLRKMYGGATARRRSWASCCDLIASATPGDGSAPDSRQSTKCSCSCQKPCV